MVGMPTLLDYMNLSEQEQKAIYNYIEDTPIMGSLIVNDKKFILVHSRPAYHEEFIKIAKKGSAFISYKSSKNYPDFLYHVLWVRDEQDTKSSYLRYMKEGFLTICGHDPGSEIKYDEQQGFLRIDTNCAGRGKLTVLRINEDGGIQKTEFNAKDNDDYKEANEENNLSKNSQMSLREIKSAVNQEKKLNFNKR